MSGAASPTKTKSPSKSPTKAQQRAAAVADAARAAALVDAIKKEERAQGRWLQRQAETDPELAAACSAASLGLSDGAGSPKAVQPPELYQTLRDHSLARPDRGSALDISQALSSSINPGYFLQDPEAIKSQSKEDFTVDEDEAQQSDRSLLSENRNRLQLEYMRAHGLLGSQHHRRQNDMSRHVEAMARSRLVVKAQNAAGAKAPAAASAAT